mmetsp:Transcript_33123/g.65888  ORF Transcript_33123/g.65888 Transcript_33123/m.65888 type:complete len:124 (-) Transcript_33123:549-920(-)
MSAAPVSAEVTCLQTHHPSSDPLPSSTSNSLCPAVLPPPSPATLSPPSLRSFSTLSPFSFHSLSILSPFSLHFCLHSVSILSPLSLHSLSISVSILSPFSLASLGSVTQLRTAAGPVQPTQAE